MTTYYVTRHPGAIKWVNQQDIQVEKQIDHLDLETVKSGDIVIGSLPVNLAAEICQRGARYIHLSLDLSQDMRGKELTVEDMINCNARLEEFVVTRKEK